MTAQAVTVGVAVLGGVLTITAGLFFYALKDLRRADGDLRRADGDRRQEIEHVRQEVSAQWREHQREMISLLERLPRTYVLREDYVRTMASVDGKLDLIRRDLQSIAQNFHDHIEKEGAP